MSVDALKQAMCDAARHLYERGHNGPLDGNISVRVDGETLLATPTGCHKGRLRPSDIVAVTAETGLPIMSGRAPSTELRLHLAIYRARPDVGAIVHAHSPSTVALSVVGGSLDKPVIPELYFAVGPVPTVPYASPTTDDVGQGVVPFLDAHQAVVLERHGPVALGGDLEEALIRLESIEHTARITLLAHTAGQPTPLPDDELARLIEHAPLPK